MMTQAKIAELRLTYKDPSEPLPYEEFHAMLDLIEHLQGKVRMATAQVEAALYWADATPKNLVEEVLVTLKKRQPPKPKDEVVPRPRGPWDEAQDEQNAAVDQALAEG